MQYNGNGTLQKFSGETLAITYAIYFPGNGNIGRIKPQQPNNEINTFLNQKIDLHLENGRMLVVTIDENGYVSFNGGQTIGFE